MPVLMRTRWLSGVPGGPTAEAGDQAHRVLRLLLADVGAGHAPAVLGEAERKRASETAAGAGDEHTFLVHRADLPRFVMLAIVCQLGGERRCRRRCYSI